MNHEFISNITALTPEQINLLLIESGLTPGTIAELNANCDISKQVLKIVK